MRRRVPVARPRPYLERVSGYASRWLEAVRRENDGIGRIFARLRGNERRTAEVTLAEFPLL